MIAVLIAAALALFIATPVHADHAWEHDSDHDSDHDVESTTEKTIEVSRGNRIHLRNHNGDVEISVWNRNAVHIWAEHHAGATVVVRENGGVRLIETGWLDQAGSHGSPFVNYQITVPAWIPIAVAGINTDVIVEGSEGGIDIETVNGDVLVEGGSGWINLSSVNGGVTLRGARGRVLANSVNDDVSLEGIIGSVFGEAVNGDIIMRTITADTIRSTTVRGDVYFQGSIDRKGHYWFSTHNGDVMLLVPESTDATVGFFTYEGHLHTSFPVTLPRLEGHGGKGRRVTFQLGQGNARIDLETFSGDIEIDWLEETNSR
jgi:hypothetical protein